MHPRGKDAKEGHEAGSELHQRGEARRVSRGSGYEAAVPTVTWEKEKVYGVLDGTKDFKLQTGEQ